MAIACAGFLGLMTALDMVLRPQIFDHPHWGISYFGGQKATLVPYYAGFAVVLACLARITYLLWRLQGRWRSLRVVFLIATALAALIAATSSMYGAFLFWLHIYAALALLLWVLGAEIWVLTRPGRSWRDYAALCTLIVGAVVVNLSATWAWGGVLGLYAWGEVVVFVGAFACLGQAAVRATSK